MLAERLCQLLLRIRKDEEIPDDFKNANIVTIFKKSDRVDCGNYRGMSLLTIAEKIFGHILLNRLRPIAEKILPEYQCSFCLARITTEMTFVARQLQEKCREQHMELSMAFMDLT